MLRPYETLREALDAALRESMVLQFRIGHALREARDAVTRSPYGRLVREPRDPLDPERGSLARVLRRARLGPTADKEREPGMLGDAGNKAGAPSAGEASPVPRATIGYTWHRANRRIPMSPHWDALGPGRVGVAGATHVCSAP